MFSNTIGKISVKQAMILFIILYFSPAIRYIPFITATKAKEAAWISPFFAFIAMMIYVVFWWMFLKKYQKESFVDITKDIMGKVIGTIIILIYFTWITVLFAYNLRIYAERLLTTATQGIDLTLILLVMLMILTYVLRHGLVNIGKMGEIIIILMFFIFILLFLLILPQIKFDMLIPITHKDMYPAFVGSFGILAIYSYNILIMIFNDRIDHKGDFKKLSVQTIFVVTLMSFLVILIPLGVFGSRVLTKISIPYLTAMSQISIFEIIERVEAGVIIFWVFSDFILFAVFAYCAIHIIKLLFKLRDTKPFINIYLLGIFFLSLILAKSNIELSALSVDVFTQWNNIMGFAIPMVIFFVGKIRKKV